MPAQDSGDPARLMVCSIESKSHVSLEMKDGSRVTGVFLPLSGDSLRIKRPYDKSRLDEPRIITLAWQDVILLEAYQSSGDDTVVGGLIGFVSLVAVLALLISTDPH